MLKKGDRVQIYENPITEEQLEGEAILVSRYRPDTGDGLSMWEVMFDSEEETVLRTISQPQPQPRFYQKWMRRVDNIVWEKAGRSLRDLPDCLYRDWYEEGIPAEQAARRALSNARYGDDVEMLP